MADVDVLCFDVLLLSLLLSLLLILFVCGETCVPIFLVGMRSGCSTSMRSGYSASIIRRRNMRAGTSLRRPLLWACVADALPACVADALPALHASGH